MATLTAHRATVERQRRSRRAGSWRPWLFALPALLVYGAFLVYPALSSLWFSITD
jgi:raffinose/stachyose/melibiose transport system permease protein